MPSDLPLRAAPRISPAGFRDVLRRHGSPAAAEAARCYAAFVAKGIDPAVGLGIFAHESSYGRLGIAPGNRSWGNIRHSGKFVRYPTWTAGAEGLAALLVVYADNRIRPGTITSTIRTFSYVYAPSADHNDPRGYGLDVLRRVLGWLATYPPRARRVAARELRNVYTRDAAGRVTRHAHPNGLTFSANAGPNVMLALVDAPARRYTFARILTGSWRGRYVHVSDPGLTFSQLR